MIHIDESLYQCYDSLFINFMVNDTFMYGYLKENNIIIVESKQIECNDKIIYKNMKSINSIIVRNKKGLIEIKSEIHKVELTELQESYQVINSPHNKGIFQTLDIMHEILKIHFSGESEDEKIMNTIITIGNYT